MATPPDWIVRSRSGWINDGSQRPVFAITPGPDQESVWDYPRPPRIEPVSKLVQVKLGDCLIASTSNAVRVLETASPPTFYLPPDDINFDYLEPAPGSSLCEWKGNAKYWNVVTPDRTLENEAWSYPDPYPEFASMKNYVAFYPRQLTCTVGDMSVTPQPGTFYAGWVTPNLTGPFKGEPGSSGW